jgi:hypothetical protein
MKRCPTCNRTFEDTLTYCLIDGSILDAPFDPHATLVIPEPRQTEPPPTEVLQPKEEAVEEIQPAISNKAESENLIEPEPTVDAATVAAPEALSGDSSESITAGTPQLLSEQSAKPKKTLLLLGILATLLIVATIIFFVVSRKAPRSINLSAEDMALMVNTMPPDYKARFASDPAARKRYAKEVLQTLAIAEEARNAGIADRPEMERLLSFARSQIIGQKYLEKTAPGVSQAERDAFLKESGQEQNFEQFVADAKARDPQASGELSDEQKSQLKQQWAQIMVAERKGRQEGLDKDRATQLEIMFQDASVLVNQYAKEKLMNQVKASDAEIDAYLAKHPELAPASGREQARDAVERDKQQKVIDEIVERWRKYITVAEDFQVKP